MLTRREDIAARIRTTRFAWELHRRFYSVMAQLARPGHQARPRGGESDCDIILSRSHRDDATTYLTKTPAADALTPPSG